MNVPQCFLFLLVAVAAVNSWRFAFPTMPQCFLSTLRSWRFEFQLASQNALFSVSRNANQVLCYGEWKNNRPEAYLFSTSIFFTQPTSRENHRSESLTFKQSRHLPRQDLAHPFCQAERPKLTRFSKSRRCSNTRSLKTGTNASPDTTGGKSAGPAALRHEKQCNKFAK